MSRGLRERLHSFGRRQDGNVTMIYALSAPMLIFGIAVAIDFTNASIVRSRLNEAADAAGLAALTPTMMGQTDAQAKAAATAMFNARAAAVGTLLPQYTNVTVTISHPTSSSGGQNMNTRIVSVDYTAQTSAIMGGVLKNVLNTNSAMTVHGSSSSQATMPPNIDFYLLLDNSPSMALPATSAGITQMQNLTPTQDGGNGCAFACHQASTNNSDTQGNLCTDLSKPTLSSGSTRSQYCDASYGKVQMDNYAMARYYKIQLRLDELTTGVSTLMSTAQSYRDSGLYATPPVYQFAAYSMDSAWSIGITNTRLMSLTSNFTNAWNSAKSSFGVMEMFSNDVTCGSANCTTSGSQNDVATNYDNSLSDMVSTLPTPGNGTNVAGDKPQEVLFFVTDGVEDESYGGRVIQTINGGRGAGTDYCAQIKAKGVKIAILYTEYLAVPKNSFYQSNVAPILSNIGPKLQACASPNLYYDAAIGTDLGAALSTLFNAVAQQAALSN